ncbi:polyprenyl diphosphate synthase, partial [Treponema socranskii]
MTSLDTTRLPRHVAIIMDGNGRWAERRHKNRSAGHYAGAEQAKKIVGAASALGIEYVTLYIFSTENWKRTAEETGYLMSLIKNHLRAEFAFYKKNKIRLLHLGDIAGLPEDIREEIRSATAETAHFTGTTLV